MDELKFLIQAAGWSYGPFDDANAAANWFMRYRPNYAAPWVIVPIVPPNGSNKGVSE